MRTFAPALLLTLAAIVAGPAHQADAGQIIVSGDINIAGALIGRPTSVDAGNQRFFTNVLGSGTRVLVQGNTGNLVSYFVTDTNAFYNTLSGVSSTIQSGPITAASLGSVNLFVGVIPSAAYTSSEIAALSAFSAAGGTIFFLGDHISFSPEDANINAALAGLGSGLRIVPDVLDPGYQTATSSQIAANPLTAGVSTFTYAAVSRVTGGTTLFTTTDGSTFIAAETGVVTNVVPEPSNLVMLGVAGVVGLGVRLVRARRRGRATA